MKWYKVCVATSKSSGKVISGLTGVVEIDDKEEKPKQGTIENERFYFDYFYFETMKDAEDFTKRIRCNEIFASK